jgi:hypothetical protein
MNVHRMIMAYLRESIRGPQVAAIGALLSSANATCRLVENDWHGEGLNCTGSKVRAGNTGVGVWVSWSLRPIFELSVKVDEVPFLKTGQMCFFSRSVAPFVLSLELSLEYAGLVLGHLSISILRLI